MRRKAKCIAKQLLNNNRRGHQKLSDALLGGEMKRKTSLLEGNIYKRIIGFTAPLIVGNLFQQLYNIVDSIIVGNFAGSNALGAVGACDAPVNIALGVCVGISAGAGVLISQSYGAKKYDKVEKLLDNIVMLSILTGVVLTLLCWVFAFLYIHISRLPIEVSGLAKIYLLIYYSGMFFFVGFNMMSGILNAVGYSRKSLEYLSVSSVMNIFLDVIFVVLFDMGVAGVALGTVLSEILVFFLTLRYLVCCNEVYAIRLNRLKIDLGLIKAIIRMSVPVGMQNIVRAFANMIIQIGINGYGTAAIAGYAIYLKIDTINWLPAMSLGVAATTFTAQNIGAGYLQRAKQGIKGAIVISCIYTFAMTILLLCFSQSIFLIFTKESAVIHHAQIALYVFTPFYALYYVMQILCGELSGKGKTTLSMLVCVFSLCVFRVLWMFMIELMNASFFWLMVGYPISWGIGMLIATVFIKREVTE